MRLALQQKIKRTPDSKITWFSVVDRIDDPARDKSRTNTCLLFKVKSSPKTQRDTGAPFSTLNFLPSLSSDTLPKWPTSPNPACAWL